MTHLNAQLLHGDRVPVDIATMVTVSCKPVVVVVTDTPRIAAVLDNICDFLGFGIELLPTAMNLAPVLERCAPMAIVTELDGHGQDGCHVMMQVAEHDPGLPILLLTGRDASLAGAADAVEELWHLTAVTKSPELPEIGRLVSFLFNAGRRGGCVRMMPA